MRETYVRRDGRVIDKNRAPLPVVARSPLPFPMIVSDQIEVQSQVDGKTYTSKAALRQSYRAQGYAEVGNDWLNNEPKKPAPKVNRKAVRDSVGRAMTRAGFQL